MRTIKFRGKTCNDNVWVYGQYLESTISWTNRKPHKSWIVPSSISNGGFIAMIQRYPVIDETIGQYTGLMDKNGVEIYEGDIVKGCWNSVFTIVWEKHSTSFQARVNDRYQREISYFGLDKLEVIGNIHDNPELLKGE